MRKLLISVIGALAFAAALAGPASAQQLYISTTVVGDGGNMDCNSGGPGVDRSFYRGLTGDVWTDSALVEFERPRGVFGVSYTYPGNCVALCAKITCVVTSTPSTFGIDELTFEIFKFGNGANPLDPASTPPIKTISMYNIGTCSCNTDACANQGLLINNTQTAQPWFCANWDANYNLNGIFGKTNGQYGYRARVKTNQVSATAGNISIEQTAAYPGQNQIPIQVNVVNIHTVRSSPTVVGRITGVAAQPYNILYRLSKDATVTIKLYDTDQAHQMVPGLMPLIRTIAVSAPRVGEGTPDGTLTNGDFWDARTSSGTLVPAGSYLAQIDASANDMWGSDLARPATVQIAIDPLQVTDVAIKPLGASATDVAVLSYMLTEDATVYVDIYPPGTQIDNTNAFPPTVGGLNRCDGGAVEADICLRHFAEHKQRRVSVNTYWDGRDAGGNPACDGDYVYVVYAELPSNGTYGSFTWNRVTTSRAMVGTLPVNRGNVLPFVTPSSTVLGSSPSVAGLDPFYFRYQPVRDTYVSMNIRDMNNNIVRRLATNEMRFANFSNREIWDGKDDAGLFVPSGSYLAELVTTDPFQCSFNRTSTTTVQFPVSMFRTVDMLTKPLLGGASDMATISFELSQPMYMDLNIYPISTVIDPSPWPPTVAATPVYNVQGMRPGRFKITEYWDGRDNSGLLVPDGRYPFTLVARSTGTTQVMTSIDEAYGYIDVSRGQIIFTTFDVIPNIPQMFSSSDVVKLPPFEIDYGVTRQSSVTIEILTLDLPQRLVATVAAGQVRDGDIEYQDFWDGKDMSGNFVTGGAYNVRIRAQDIASQITSRATVQMTIDVYPLRVYDVSILPLTIDVPAAISYQVSEPMKVVTKIYKPGTTFVGDSPYPPEATSLVKRIIGVRPSRTQITEYWDGTDLTLSKVPDGNYVFKIYASTVTEAISTIDGSYSSSLCPSGSCLADDIITANIPVTKGGTADLCGEFSHDTFFAPNPYTGKSGWFRIPLPMNGRVTMKMYNLAGDLVYKKDFGNRGGGDNVDGSGKCLNTQTHEACWPKVNSYGKTVAPGVYFAVIRFEATEGTRDICQTVKKILVP
jgi:flagellar hook assembly protein FlgD